MPFKKILQEFEIDEATAIITPFGNGLINSTWLVEYNGNKYILQRINHHVFTQPEFIDININRLGNFLALNHPEYYYTIPLRNKDGNSLIKIEHEGYFRIFPFVKDSHSKDIVSKPEQAFEAAAQFGKFTYMLSDFDIQQLKVTIPDFHNLSLRYQLFQNALQTGNSVRIAEAHSLIKTILNNLQIVEEYEKLILNKDFKKRVTHHDTKISNVLFNSNDQGLCVIDLDTVMPGYFISDVGDMMRTYLCSVSEEETDFSKIHIRDDYFNAIVKGYHQEMKKELTDAEVNYFFYAGLFAIYMQAIRFLTDYFLNDIYYGAKYDKHNLNRAANQLVLLEHLLAKKSTLDSIL